MIIVSLLAELLQDTFFTWINILLAMNKSLSQLSSRKSTASPLPTANARLGKYTEVMIETNDEEVPFIAVFKPDIRRKQSKAQTITAIEKSLRKGQVLRMQFAFHRMAQLKQLNHCLLIKARSLQSVFTRLVQKRANRAFISMLLNKVKMRNRAVGLGLLHYFAKNRIRNNIKHAANKLSMNSHQMQINSMQDSSEQTRQLAQAKEQILSLQSTAFSQDFLSKSKPILKKFDAESYINNLRNLNYEQTVKKEKERFEKMRREGPRRKEFFDNQQITTVLENCLKAYEGLLAESYGEQEELRRQLEGYSNKQGIQQVKSLVVQRDAVLADIQSFASEISRMDGEMGKISGEKFSFDRLATLVVSYEKKLKGKKAQGVLSKLVSSRISSNSLVGSLIRRFMDDREVMGKQIDELALAGDEESKVIELMKKLKENSMRGLGQRFLDLHSRISQCQKTIAEKELRLSRNYVSLLDQSSKLSQGNTIDKKQIMLNEQQQRLGQQSIVIEKHLSSIEELQKKYKTEKNNIEFVLSFLQLSPEAQLQFNQSIPTRISPIINFITTLLQDNSRMQHLIQADQRQVILQQRGSNPFSETKPIGEVSPLRLRESQLSLADRFMSPGREILQEREHGYESRQKDQSDLTDKQIRFQEKMIGFEEKMEQIINHNIILQERLLQLQAGNRIIDELSTRNGDLKQQYEDLKLNFNQLLARNNQLENKSHQFLLSQRSEERQKPLTLAQIEQIQLRQQVGNYEAQIKQLLSLNTQLTEQVDSLKKSNSQLVPSVKQAYERSSSKALSESNQQLMKQTELIKDIFSLKLQLETQKMEFLKETTTTKDQINSYQTIISKLEADLTLKDEQNLQQAFIIQSLRNKYEEEKENSQDLKSQIEQIEVSLRDEANSHFKTSEMELSRLKRQCGKIQEQLHKSVDSLRSRDAKIGSLQGSLRELQQANDVVGMEKEMLRKENERLVAGMEQFAHKEVVAQQQIERQKVEINHIKSQYHQLKARQKNEGRLQALQLEVGQKQGTINRLTEDAERERSSLNSQLEQVRQQFLQREEQLLQSVCEKELLIGKLEVELGERANTVQSLEHLIALYGEDKQSEPSNPQQQQMKQLCQQVKSLEEFLHELTQQHRELESKYQQERQRGGFGPNINTSTIDPKEESGFLSEAGGRLMELGESFKVENLNGVSEKDLCEQLRRVFPSNQSSVECVREESKEPFMKAKNSSSNQPILELVCGILLTVTRIPINSQQAHQMRAQLSDLCATHSGQLLFLSLQSYCRQLIENYASTP